MSDTTPAGTRPAWLVRAKVQAPRHQVSVAPRAALLERLDKASRRALTLLVAPAGYGKSTLLAAWCERLAADAAATVAWLTLGRDDIQDAFVAYLGYALEAAGVMLPPAFWQRDYLDDGRRAAQAIAVLVNVIEAHGHSTVVVLDDFETLDDRETTALIDQLIRQRPPNLHLLIASRSTPPMPLSDLRLRGLVSDFAAADLQFTDAELKDYFDAAAGAPLLQAIRTHTEGWPVAVQVLRQCLGQGKVGNDMGKCIAESTQLASDYIREHLLRALPDNYRATLRDLAVLDWIQADAVAALFDNAPPACLNNALQSVGAMVTTRGDDTRRMHPILRECLGAELAAADPERHQTLHRRAAYWLAVQGRLVAALRHAAVAGNIALVGELIERAGAVRIWMIHGTAQLLAVDRFCSDSVVQAFPRLALIRCIVHGKAARYREAAACFEHISRVTENFCRDRAGGDSEALQTDSIIVAATLSVYGCAPLGPELIAQLSQIRLADAASDRAMQGYRKTLLCVANHQIAKFDDAMRSARESMLHHRQLNPHENSAFLHLHMGSIEFVRGNGEAADKHYLSTRQTARAGFPRDAGLRLGIDTFAAELALERNSFEGVRRRLPSISSRLYRAEAWFDIYAAAYRTQAEYLFFQKGSSDALCFLDDARAYIEEQRLDHLSNLVGATRISVLCLAGQIDEAGRLLADGSVRDPGSAQNWRWREAEAYVLAALRLFSALGRHRQAQALVDKYTLLFQHRDLFRSLLNMRVLGAGDAWRSDCKARAVELLSAALEQVQASTYTRALWRDQVTVVPILEHLLDDEYHPQRAAAQSALARLQGIEVSAAREPALSPREMDVLRELRKGLQDKVIARRLGVTEHTVRFHLRNIYAKTDANSRLEAVARAQRLGILG